MNFKRIYFFAITMLLAITAHAALSDISGKVVDAKTNESLPGATIAFPELKRTVSTDLNGEFSLSNVPSKGSYLVEISFIGYKTFTRSVDFSKASALTFSLQPGAIEAHEVVITGVAVSAGGKRSSTQSTVVSRAQLLNASTNLVDALSKVAGVSQISTGPAISKPIIRGLGYNRVVTLDDGVKQQGQQWGDEHGIEIDQFKADRVEVLRGAASLLYGSDALGGVINLVEPLSPPEGRIRGELVSNYSSNNGLTGSSAMLTGNSGGLVWRGRASYKNAYSFKTPTGYFPNSGFNETDLSGMIGLNKSWGYSHLNVSSFRNNIGFYEPAFDASGNFVNENGELFSSRQLKNRSLEYPRQDIRHYKIALNNNFIIGSGSLKADLGFQKNQRRELEDSADPSLFFNLDTYNADLKYYPHEQNGWQPVYGLSTDLGHSENKGVEYLIPAYDTYGIGVFAYLKKNWENSTINAGLRYDYRMNKGKQLIEDGEERFTAFKNTFSNISAALGFTHQFNEAWNLKANLGSAFRAPNPAELGSNGVHEGTFRYEIGNPDLNPERSYQADAALEFEGKTASASLSIYNNYIHDYIYASNNSGELINAEESDYPVYRYGQVNANLYGVEASLTLHPVTFIHMENTFGVTEARNITLDKPLPFIPAASLRNELRFVPKFKNIQDAFFSVGIANYFDQNRVDPEFEISSAGYTLLNAGIGAAFKLGKQVVKLSVSGNNLLDKKYYDALSRLKPGRLDQTDPSVGVYNAGRNISVGLYLPFGFRG